MPFNIQSVLARLYTLGYKKQPADDIKLEFIIGKTRDYILNFCNINQIPAELVYAAIDMACGEFLSEKINTGELELNNLDLSSANVSSISEGDTKVTFENVSQKAERLVNSLLASKEQLYKFRRIAW